MSDTSRGMIGNAAAGYRLAWIHWWKLLAVLLPVLAAALAGLLALDLLLGRDHMVMINGVPVVREDNETARLGLIVALWMLALPAAALVATGAARGHTIRPGRAILAGLRTFPVFAVGAFVLAGGTFLAVRAVAAVPVLVFGVLAVAAVVAARLLGGVLSYRLGGRPPSAAGAFLLGGIGVPLVVAYLGRGLPQPIGAVLLTCLVAVQAGILAHVYLLQDDLTAVDARLAELSGRPPRRTAAVAAVATVLAVLAPAGVALANPFDAPTVRSVGAQGGVAAVAWPAGRHPVIATITGARFCDDDVCDRSVSQDGGPAVMDGHGVAGISADGGTVVKAVLSGGLDNGGPFLDYARCTRDGCRQAWLPVRASAREPFGWPELAAAVAPDQALWFALAMPSRENRPGKATYRITFLRCADVPCTTPQRYDAGTVERTPDDETTDDAAADGRRVELTVGADGRPLATVRTGMEAFLVTTASSTKVSAGPPGTAWATTGQQVISLQPGTLRVGQQTMPLPGNAIALRSGALAVTGSRVYATAAEATAPPGLHVTVGNGQEQQPAYWQQVLWRCEQAGCRRLVLDAFATTTGLEMMAVAADGRVLIVRQDRILLVSAAD